MTDTNQEATVNLTIKVPEHVRQGLKIVSALQARTMQEVGAEILAEGVEKRRKVRVG